MLGKNVPAPTVCDPQDIFGNAPIGIFISTPEGKLLSANLAMARMFGYGSPQKMIESVTDIGRQVYANPADREENLWLLGKNHVGVNHECCFRHREGTELWGA